MSMGKNTVWLTTTKIINTVITMLITMLLSRFRTLEEYGTFSQINIITTVVTTVFALGLPNCVNFFLNRTEKKEEKQDFLSAYFTLGSVISVIIALVLFIAFPLLTSFFKNEALNDYKFAVLMFPWVNLFNSSVENIYIAYNKINLLIAYRMSYAVILLVTVSIFSAVGGSFYVYMIVYMALQAVFVLLLYITSYIISGKIRFNFDKKIISEILKYSIPLGISSIISTLNIELDKIMVGRMFTMEDLAIYTNVAKELPINILTISVTALLLPKMVSLIQGKKESTAVDLWGTSILISSIIICFVNMLLFVMSDSVIGVLYSEKYLPGNAVFKVYTITSLVKITSWQIILVSTKNTKKILHIAIIALSVNFVLNLIFMKLFGMIGAAFATMFSELVTIGLKLYFSSKAINISFKKILPWMSLFKIITLNVLLGALATLVYALLKSNLANMYIGAILSAVIIFIIYVSIIIKPFKKLWVEFNKN